MLGREAEIWQPLLAFNLGLEVGQILIVVITLFVSFILLEVLRVRKHDWNLILSATILGMALTLLAKAEFWGRILAFFVEI
jgi:HupE / UreJ protein